MIRDLLLEWLHVTIDFNNGRNFAAVLATNFPWGVCSNWKYDSLLVSTVIMRTFEKV